LYTLSDAHFPARGALESIVHALTEQHPEVVARAEDAVGAKLVHCLLVGNNLRSINLALELFEIHPPLLLGTHGQHSANKPVFTGEGSLHIVAVNQRCEAAVAMVRTAVSRLRTEEVQELLTQTCTGLFFKGAPMRYFGGSAMSFLSVFGVLVPVLPLLDSQPDVRRAALSCKGKRGYTALHATVMAGRVPEFDALIYHGCDEFAEDRDGLTPMRLAVKMGMRDMFIHSVRHRIKTEWVWGPIAAYKLPLIGLDTEGFAGAQTVMDLTADTVADDRTAQMLLDSFMNGFIFNLFVEKWHRWARYLWAFQLLVDWSLVSSITVLASPSIFGRRGAETDLKLQAWICLVIMAYVLEEQVRELATFLHANLKHLRRSRSARNSLMQDWLLGRIDNWLLITSVIFVSTRLVIADDPHVANAEPALRVMVAIAASLAWLQVFLNSFVPFERFGVFVLLVSRMVFGDITTWSVIVLPWLLGLTTSANAVSLGATEVPFVGEGGHSLAYWPYALESFTLMFTNGVTPIWQAYFYMGQDTGDGVDRLRQLKKSGGSGGSATLSLDKEESDYPSQLMLDDNYHPALGIFFYVFYAVFCYIVLIMLLNLLIAMMGNTYAAAMEKATLEWRGEFARLILKLELSTFNTPMTWLPYAAKRTAYVERLTKLGTTLPGEGDARYYSFQSYTVSEGMELHGTLGDIFKDAPKRPGAQQSKGVEKPAASKRARSSRLLDIFSAAKKSSEEQSKSKEQNSEIASMAAELRHCQAQLAQLIELAKQKETVQVNGTLQRKVLGPPKSPVPSDGGGSTGVPFIGEAAMCLAPARPKHRRPRTVQPAGVMMNSRKTTAAPAPTASRAPFGSSSGGD
jgi:hypothetical protein